MSEFVFDLAAPPLKAFYRRLGNGRIVATDADAGRATVEFTADPDMCHSQHLVEGGIVQGGYICAWLDNAMANAALGYSGGARTVATLELKMSFFNTARGGVPLRAEAWIARSGKKVLFLEGQLTDAAGSVLAKATSTAQWIDLA